MLVPSLSRAAAFHNFDTKVLVVLDYQSLTGVSCMRHMFLGSFELYDMASKLDIISIMRVFSSAVL